VPRIVLVMIFDIHGGFVSSGDVVVLLQNVHRSHGGRDLVGGEDGLPCWSCNTGMIDVARLLLFILTSITIFVLSQ
jgi:hypothetical protein